MRTKTLYVDQNIDCEYDIQFNDILELIESCSISEKEEILDVIDSRPLGTSQEQQIVCETLYDQEKLKVLKFAFEKYNLDQLMKKLEINYIDI
jgi:hypothetical protein